MLVQHRNTGTITSVVLACIISLVSCGQSGINSANGVNPAVSGKSAVAKPDYGPGVDRIIIETRKDQSQALADVVAGTADLILNSLPPAALQDLGPAEREKLQVLSVPAESWSILINPIPNAAPFTWTTASGETSFNPLAIREVRYALNWLFNRQHLVDEILGGHGVPGFTPLPPGQAPTSRYDAVPAGLGMSATGDVDRAIKDITDAMDAAARLPENTGRLLRAADGFWQYDGKPVTIKFLIRADEPAGRLPAGRYLASRLEKAGIRVQLLERDRSALATAYYSDPADLAFHIYLEAWAPRTGTPSWDLTIARQYAPRFGFLPGGADTAWWQYRNPELDRLTVGTAEAQSDREDKQSDKLSDSLKILETGLKEAVRVYLAFHHDSYLTSKGRFSSPLKLGPEAGLSGRFLRTASVEAGPDGTRVLRVLHIQNADNASPGNSDQASPADLTNRFYWTLAELVSEGIPLPKAGLYSGTDRASGDELPDPAGTPGWPFRWHNGIETSKDDITYAGNYASSPEAGWNTRVSLPWDLREVLDQVLAQLSAESTATGLQTDLQPDLSLVSPQTVDLILAQYRKLLELQWVPPELNGLVNPEQAARRYQASISFIEKHGHALISNGPFVLSSLDSTTGTAVLEAFQEYPYGSDYPVQPAKD
jgi:hypothetical protein